MASANTAYRGDYAVVTTGERSITLRLSPEEFKQLDRIARIQNLNRTAIIRNAILRLLKSNLSGTGTTMPAADRRNHEQCNASS